MLLRVKRSQHRLKRPRSALVLLAYAIKTQQEPDSGCSQPITHEC